MSVLRWKRCFALLVFWAFAGSSVAAYGATCDEVFKTYKRYLEQAEKSQSKVERQGLLMIFLTFEQGNPRCFLQGRGPRLLVRRQEIYSRPKARKRPAPKKRAATKPRAVPPTKPAARRPALAPRPAPPRREAPPSSPPPGFRQERAPAAPQNAYLWALELGAMSFAYQRFSPPITDNDPIRSMSFSGILLGFRWGHRWDRFLLTGDLHYLIGGGSLFQVGVTAGYVVYKYFVFEAGLAFNLGSTFEEDFQKPQLSVPFEFGALVRFPFRWINLGLRLTTGLAFDNTNSALSWSIRLNLLAGSLF